MTAQQRHTICPWSTLLSCILGFLQWHKPRQEVDPLFSLPVTPVLWLYNTLRLTWILKVCNCFPLDLVKHLILTWPGQHHLLSSIVLHLRYPNAHTHWFSSLLLYLFLEVNSDRFREVLTKVLLERFIVHRPHPWGALVTFIELLRNPKYDFWSKDFIRIAPEVTLLLESVRLYHWS